MFAHEVKPSLRLAQCVSAATYVFLSAGIIFGFAALKPILISENVYLSQCDISTKHDTLEAQCLDQDMKLNNLFTIGAALTNISSIFIGKVLDVYGPKVCGLIGAGLLYLACFIFIKATTLQSAYFDPYLTGFALLSLGGPFAFLPSLQLSNSFPLRSGTILSILSCSFDASSSVFLGFKYVFNKTAGKFQIADFFKIYLLVPLFITITQVTIMNPESYLAPMTTRLSVDSTANEEEGEHVNTSETTSLLRNNSDRRDSIGDAMKQHFEIKREKSVDVSVFGILHGKTSKEQLKSWWFVLFTTLAIIMMLRINYFVSTIRSQYAWLFESMKEAKRINNFFDIILPLAGVFTAPFIGFILDNFSSFKILVFMAITSITIGFSGLFGIKFLAYFNIIVFSMFRPFFYACYADLFAKVFGFENFGFIYGSSMAIAGLWNLSQSILDYLTHNTFKLNPIPVNVALLVLTGVISTGVCVFVFREGKRYREL